MKSSPPSFGQHASPWFAALLACFLALTIPSSPAQDTGVDPPYTVVDRGAFYRVWQKTVSVTNSQTGQITQDIQTALSEWISM
jgi:hypothetical protein